MTSTIVRPEIAELNDNELADSVEAFAVLLRDEMAAPRTAEIMVEAARRLRKKT